MRAGLPFEFKACKLKLFSAQHRTPHLACTCAGLRSAALRSESSASCPMLLFKRPLMLDCLHPHRLPKVLLLTKRTSPI